MTDLTITATSVKKTTTTKTKHGVAGAAITAGQLLALDASTGTLKLFDADSATAALRVPTGIALNGAATDQPVEYAYAGPVTIGATVAAGIPYFGSKTGGGICPFADLASGGYNSLVGFGISTTQIDINFVSAGVVQ